MDDNQIRVEYKLKKKCKSPNCDGNLILSEVYSKQEDKGKCIPMKRCDKCGQLFISYNSYLILKECICREAYDIVNSPDEILRMKLRREMTLERRKKRKELQKINAERKRQNKEIARINKYNFYATQKKAYAVGHCRKCGDKEYRTGLGLCWECYKTEKTGY